MDKEATEKALRLINGLQKDMDRIMIENFKMDQEIKRLKKEMKALKIKDPEPILKDLTE